MLLDVQVGHKFLESMVHELGSVVCDNLRWYPEAGNDIVPEEFHHSGRGYCGQWLGFDPLREVVHRDYEPFELSLRRSEWSEDVHAPFEEGPGGWHSFQV